MLHPSIAIAARAICVLALGVVMTACGGAEKSPEDKAILFNAPTSQKSGASPVQFASTAVTALAGGGVEKGVGSLPSGQTMTESLSAMDDPLDDGAYGDIWVFDVDGEAEVTITLSSGSFDTMLHLGTPDGEVLATNDDADGTNSEIQAKLGAGRYAAVATSYAAGETGAYEIRLEVGGGSLSAGASVSGALTAGPTLQDGSYYEDWPINGRGGDRVTLTLRSGDFDAYLMVLQNGEIIASDDDSAGGTDSQIDMTLPSTGSYVVRANSYGEGATGGYTLSMEGGGGATGFAGFGTGGDPNGRYALLVGIDDYPGTGSDLRGPVEDARIMERVLTQRFGFDPANVVTLNDSDATRANIAQGIVQHLGQAGPDGVAVFFYSGHGTQVGENIGLTGSLDPEPRGDGDEAIYIYGHTQESSLLLDEELGFLIESIDANRSLVVVDACFSGEITRASGDAPQSKVVDLSDPEVADNVRLPTNFITSELKSLDLYDMSLGFGDFDQIARVFQNPQRHIAWGGSTEDQVSWTSSLGNGASVFAYYVGEHMIDAAGSMTFGQLQEVVHGDVVNYIEADGNMTMQNPSMRGPYQNMTLDDFFRQR